MYYLRLDMYLIQLPQVDGVLCHQTFERPAYPVDDYAGDDAAQGDYGKDDYAEQEYGYASQEEDQQQ